MTFSSVPQIVGRTAALCVVAVLAGGSGQETAAQVAWAHGQSVVPVYEGWEQNPDGSFNLVFGYFNRNPEEELDIPVGPGNFLEPGAADQGQPTHFYPQRSRFLFRVRVAADFGDGEVVWTLVSNGRTERAYGTLKTDYYIDDIVVMNNNGAGGQAGGGNDLFGNTAPDLQVDGDLTRHVRVGEPVQLTARASDDGIPTPRAVPFTPLLGGRCCPDAAAGLRLSWFVYRGANDVVFDPPQFDAWENYRDWADSPYAAGWETPPAPPDGRWVVQATFSKPGTYVLRCLAHDGGLMTTEDVTFIVSR